MTLPGGRHKKRSPQEERSGQIHGVGQGAHHQGSQDLASIRHHAQPADGHPLQGWRNLIADEGCRDGGHEAPDSPDRETPEAER